MPEKKIDMRTISQSKFFKTLTFKLSKEHVEKLEKAVKEGPFESMSEVAMNVTEGQVHMVTPFLHGNKESILDWGFQHKVPYEFTRTCYKDQEESCGKCGACQERLEAFAAHGVTDPIQYEEGVQSNEG